MSGLRDSSVQNLYATDGHDIIYELFASVPCKSSQFRYLVLRKQFYTRLVKRLYHFTKLIKLWSCPRRSSNIPKRLMHSLYISYVARDYRGALKCSYSVDSGSLESRSLIKLVIIFCILYSYQTRLNKIPPSNPFSILSEVLILS